MGCCKPGSLPCKSAQISMSTVNERFGKLFRVYEWITSNKRHIALASGAVLGSISVIKSMRQIPPDHIGIVRNLSGGLRQHVFHSSEIALIIPWWEQVILMREKPVQKRFIKEFKSLDGKTVEARLVVAIEPPVHWMPEIFYKFGRDFGRTFLEREAVIDFEEVCKKYKKSELIEEGPQKEAAIQDLELRISDAATYHRLKMDELRITFLDPDLDVDEY